MWPSTRSACHDPIEVGCAVTPPDRATTREPSGPRDERFQRLAGAALDEALALHPDMATELGDHRFDDRLPDGRPEALDEERRMLDARLRELEALDLVTLLPDNRVDTEILGAALRARRYELDVLREHEWNPLVANPAGAVYTLLAREFAPLAERLRSLAGRLAAVPESLEVARRTLHDMPRVHLETAIGQFAGAEGLIGQEVDAALEAEPALRPEVDAVRPAAHRARAVRPQAGPHPGRRRDRRRDPRQSRGRSGQGRGGDRPHRLAPGGRRSGRARGGAQSAGPARRGPARRHHHPRPLPARAGGGDRLRPRA